MDWALEPDVFAVAGRICFVRTTPGVMYFSGGVSYRAGGVCRLHDKIHVAACWVVPAVFGNISLLPHRTAERVAEKRLLALP